MMLGDCKPDRADPPTRFHDDWECDLPARKSLPRSFELNIASRCCQTAAMEKSGGFEFVVANRDDLRRRDERKCSYFQKTSPMRGEQRQLRFERWDQKAHTLLAADRQKYVEIVVGIRRGHDKTVVGDLQRGSIRGGITCEYLPTVV